MVGGAVCNVQYPWVAGGGWWMVEKKRTFKLFRNKNVSEDRSIMM